MSNIRNTNYKRLDAKLDYSSLNDFALVFNDDLSICNNTTYDNYNHICLVSWFDFDKSFVYQDNIKDTDHSNTIFSIRHWDKRQIPKDILTIPNYGLTGLDNGGVKFKSIENDYCYINDEESPLYNLLTNSELIIQGNKKHHFFMSKVSSFDDEFTLDVTIDKSEKYKNVGNYASFKGGFYQGFYMLDGYNYQTLPNRYENGFTINLWVYKSDDILTGNEV